MRASRGSRYIVSAGGTNPAGAICGSQRRRVHVSPPEIIDELNQSSVGVIGTSAEDCRRVHRKYQRGCSDGYSESNSTSVHSAFPPVQGTLTRP